ncbi:MAG: flagellar brake protein [Bacillota bacterium]
MDENNALKEFLKPGKNVQLEFTADNGRKLIYRTVVWDFDQDQLRLLLPKNDAFFNNLAPDTKVTLICRNDTEENDYVLATQFIKTEPGQPLLVIEKPADIKFTVGRRFFRCEVNLPFDGFLKKDKFKGQVINLSANGLYAIINPTLQMEPGSILTCRMLLPTSNEPLLFVGKVIRIVRKENFQGVGLSFEHATKILQDQITKYLFQRQRALINLGQIKIVKGV